MYIYIYMYIIYIEKLMKWIDKLIENGIERRCVPVIYADFRNAWKRKYAVEMCLICL